MDIHVRGLDPELVAHLKKRGERFGRSLEEELKLIVEEEARRIESTRRFETELLELRKKMRQRKTKASPLSRRGAGTADAARRDRRECCREVAQ